MSAVALKNLAEIERNGVAPEQIGGGTRYLGLEHIESGGRILGSETVDTGDLASAKFRFTPDHLLFGKLRPYLAKIALPDFAGICSTDILPVRPGPELDRRYLAFFLRQPSIVDLASSRATGANLPRLSPKALGEIEIPWRPLPEQRRIAAILDQADALRRLRRRSLSRLSDLGKAIFFEMFGDPNQLQGAHRTMEVGKFCSVSSGSTPRRDNHEYYEGNIPWVKTTEVKGSIIRRTEECITEEGKRSARLKVYPKGTILIAMYGQGKTRGNVGILGIDATINQACAAIQCDENCRPRFLFLQLRMAYERLRALGQGGNQPNLNAQLIKAFPVLLPRIDKQDTFLQKVDAVDASATSAVGQSENFDQLFASLQHRAFRGEL